MSVGDLLTCISIHGKVPAFKKGKVKVTIIATTTGHQWTYDDDGHDDDDDDDEDDCGGRSKLG